MGIIRVKAIELIMDWNLWPRHTVQKLDSTNLAGMKEALKSGFPLPPPVVAQDMRIVDGFHRVKSYLSVFGDGVEIDVDLREYPDETSMIVEAGALNSIQGLRLSPQDKAYFILKCRKMKVPPKAIAAALHMDTDRMMEFLKKRTAKTRNGENIALPAGAKSLAGKKLTKAQEHYVKTATGCVPEMYTQILINALKAEAMILTDRAISKLQELRDLIDDVLGGVAV